jgi:hypothetical protein
MVKRKIDTPADLAEARKKQIATICRLTDCSEAAAERVASKGDVGVPAASQQTPAHPAVVAMSRVYSAVQQTAGLDEAAFVGAFAGLNDEEKMAKTDAIGKIADETQTLSHEWFLEELAAVDAEESARASSSSSN